ncbi:MAG: LytTR family DNA-binding domain-containing protein [Bacteroidales bacterium]|nr:LytTR family DNA-binding domain-containing protein [Bacteroidales bacterium]
MPDKISCIIVDDEPVAREILLSHLSQIEAVSVVASCKSAIEAFNVINDKQVDLIFLDINMPSISGLSFAKSINRDIRIIFTTAYREYAIDGFDLQAVDYLLKPISFERLLQALNKYIGENGQQVRAEPERAEKDKPDYFFVRSDRKMIKIPFDEIQYVESIGDYVKIYLEGKTVVTRESMSGVEAKLPQSAFLRTHRSFIVAFDHIDSFTSEYIEIGKTQVPVSRSYKDIVMERLGGKDTIR